MRYITLLNLGRSVAKLPAVNKFKSLYVNRVRRWYKDNAHLFLGKKGLEVGGPSPIFAHNAPIPTYSHASSIDNVNWASNTMWSSHIEGGPFAPYSSEILGREYIFDSTAFPPDFFEKYDFMQCSHVLEHIANPVKAILSWRAILKTKGVAIILVPNKDFTYDVDRPSTSLEHLLEDYQSNTGEDDDTHFSEIIEMHNFKYDNSSVLEGSDRKEWAAKVKNNFNSRMAHHHCFSGDVLIELMRLCGFKVIALDKFLPHHIAIISVKTEEQPEILQQN